MPVSSSATSRATSRVSSRASPHVFIVPGWHGSGAAHWQSRWEARHCFKPVQQAVWGCPRRRDWTAHRDTYVQADPRPTVVVAHSLGWLQRSIHVNAVKAVGARP